MPHSDPAIVRFAVIGLGHFAQTAILPAFANATDNAKLSALVTGDADKATKPRIAPSLLTRRAAHLSDRQDHQPILRLSVRIRCLRILP